MHCSDALPSVTFDAAWPRYDLRALPYPEPMQRALDIADTLASGETVCVLTPQRPTPLLEVLVTLGLQARISALSDGGVQVLIHRPAHHDATGT